VKPTDLLFSQESVSFWSKDPQGRRIDLEQLGQVIRTNPGAVDAVDVVINPLGQLVSADNRRPTAAILANASEISIRPHAPGELLSRGDVDRFERQTWEQAVAGRIFAQDDRPGGYLFRDTFRQGSDVIPRVTGLPKDHPWTNQYGTTPSTRRR
jgi:hypothetical protein